MYYGEVQVTLNPRAKIPSEAAASLAAGGELEAAAALESS
jgi:hypothetical protein